MKYFSEFYRILEQFHEPRIETVDREFRSRKESKEFKLYEGIGSGLFPDDTAAASTLYALAKPDAPKYHSLKNRLKGRILNSIFHLNVKRAGFSKSAQAFYIGHRRVFLVQVLAALGASRSAKRMAETTLDLAAKFGMTDVELEMARMLRQHASDMGKTKEFDYYNLLFKELLSKYKDEQLSAEYFERITMMLRRSAGGRSKYSKEFQGYESELRQMLNDKSTYNFKLNYHRVRAWTGVAIGNHAEVIAASRDGLEFLDSDLERLQKPRKGDFWFNQFIGYLGIHDYEAAEKAANECVPFYDVGTNRWFDYAELKFLLLMNTLKFPEANALFNEVTTHPRFSLQGEISGGHWDVFRFYLIYALRSIPDVTKTDLPQLNYRLLLKAEYARRDKAGMNMLIRIAQVLHLVEERRYNELDNAIPAIGTYRQNHIDASKTEQSALFMQLVRTMHRESFRYGDCLERGKVPYEKLKTGKFEIIDLDQEIQVLPYTWLWDRLLERIKENEKSREGRRY